MTIKDPAADAVTAMTGQTLGGVALVSGTNLFSSGMRPDDYVTAPAVFCLTTGGAGPIAYLNGNRAGMQRAALQTIIRGGVGDFSGGETLARAVYAALHLLTPSGYVLFSARESAPVYLGDDEKNRGQWTINLECLYET